MILAEEEEDFLSSRHHNLITRAWWQWQVYSCAERTNGQHLWILQLLHPDDRCFWTVELGCGACPLTFNDRIADGLDMFVLEHEGVTVEEGHHNSAEPMWLHVVVEVEWQQYWTEYGFEYDVLVDVFPQGSWIEGEWGG